MREKVRTLRRNFGSLQIMPIKGSTGVDLLLAGHHFHLMGAHTAGVVQVQFHRGRMLRSLLMMNKKGMTIGISLATMMNQINLLIGSHQGVIVGMMTIADVIGLWMTTIDVILDHPILLPGIYKTAIYWITLGQIESMVYRLCKRCRHILSC